MPNFLNKIKNTKKNQTGSMLVVMIVATGIFFMITSAAISLALLQQKLNIRKVAYAQTLHIAEAGVNYYRWVLYHDHEEYCNKETCLTGPDYGPYGPYAYTDSAGKNISGYYELYITPPPQNGSTLVKVKSVGWVANYPQIKRYIEVQVGIPSWSSYSTLANADIRFGAGTEVWGPLHSNGGIRFDGLSHNLITSSLLDYNDPDHSGGNEFGVHTHISPADPLPDGNNPPLNVPIRTDVFMAGREFPMPIISFDLLDGYINNVYDKAAASGIVIDPAAGAWGNCVASTCDEGFHITLRTDNKIDVRGVSSVYASCSGNPSNSINTETPIISTLSIPANGLIFIKHKIWVDGQIDNSRVTILSFQEPFTGGSADIIINNDLMYTNGNGADAIGLIAQRDISIGQYSEDDLRVDAALIAKDGRVGRNYYGGGCASYIRNTITVNGSLATRNRYGFAYTDGTGYQIRNLIYDNNLTFMPPPHFPTTGEYTFISWKEK